MDILKSDWRIESDAGLSRRAIRDASKEDMDRRHYAQNATKDEVHGYHSGMPDSRQSNVAEAGDECDRNPQEEEPLLVRCQQI